MERVQFRGLSADFPRSGKVDFSPVTAGGSGFGGGIIPYTALEVGM